MLPKRANEGDAGYDLFSCRRYTVGTPIAVKLLKTEYQYQYHMELMHVLPHVQDCGKNGIDVGAGVIDESYRGEVGVVLFNHSDTGFSNRKKGDRIAQLILTVIMTPDVVEVNELNNTERGTGGIWINRKINKIE